MASDKAKAGSVQPDPDGRDRVGRRRAFAIAGLLWQTLAFGLFIALWFVLMNRGLQDPVAGPELRQDLETVSSTFDSWRVAVGAFVILALFGAAKWWMGQRLERRPMALAAV